MLQGVIKSFDPVTGDGVVMCDVPDLSGPTPRFDEYELSPDALAGSVFRMLRQGQRVCFTLTPDGLAHELSLGSEIDMSTPGFPRAARHADPVAD